MAGKAGHRAFGRIRKQPSKRFQASYVGPDGLRHVAPSTFTTKQDAEGWLSAEDRLTSSPDWRSPAARSAARRASQLTLADYADTWLSQRTLKPRTVALYRDLLDRRILPPLGDLHVDQITPALVRDWYSRLDASKPRQRAHAYALLRTVCTTAVADELLAANPCRIRGGGQAKRASETDNAQPDASTKFTNLSLQIQMQQHKEWCVPASTRAILTHFGVKLSQKSIANTEGTNSGGTKFGAAPPVLNAHQEYNDYVIVNPLSSTNVFSRVKTDVDNWNSLLLAGIQGSKLPIWRANGYAGNHGIVLYGYGSDKTSIQYFDPLDATPMYGRHVAAKSDIYAALNGNGNELVF